MKVISMGGGGGKAVQMRKIFIWEGGVIEKK
jgi:hypothetical protein